MGYEAIHQKLEKYFNTPLLPYSPTPDCGALRWR